LDGPVVLSAAGEARREAIRCEMYAAMGTRKRRRWAVRIGAGLAPVFAAAALLASGGRSGAGAGKPEMGGGREASAGGFRHLAFEQVATRAGLAEELGPSERTAAIGGRGGGELGGARR